MEEGKQQRYVQGEWLNLRLGRKVFTCKFCDREFHSSQALGGHQNAHRREKTMFAHCIMASQSALGMQPRPRAHEPDQGDGLAMPSPKIAHPYALQEPPNFSWPGSSKREERLDPIDGPDLDLKL